ncbi:MAG: valine--tRNA ligase [Patescibacteria group bacterium]
MPKEIAKAYEPNKYEADIYRMWEEGGYFRSEIDENKEPFVIMMPPPNATGVLHLGHALGMTVEDAVIRYKRMSIDDRGNKKYSTLWLPGTDHAAIATQTKVEKIMAKEGLTREGLGREKFLDRVREYVAQSQDTIRAQIRAMGASCDWSREAYTFSDELSRAVDEAFKRLYNDGLIYRGNRIVNWCPRCASTLADDEVEYEDEKTILYTFKYDAKFPITIATTRPETKLADTAVAVHPDDERYHKFIGETLTADFCGQKLELKVIADPGVEKDFGTGALGVTPAHSQVDFEMATKHGLKIIKIIDEQGKMNEAAGKEYAGLTVKEARAKVVAGLRKKGLIADEQEINHSLSVCYRCGTAVEPLTSEQWFVDVNKKVSKWNFDELDLEAGRKYSLKDVSLHVVRSGLIEFMPKRMEKVYFNWMENLRDWCISRQIWWGHRIPVWYRKDNIVGVDPCVDPHFDPCVDPHFDPGGGHRKGGHMGPPVRNNANIHIGNHPPSDGEWIQDEDTLDTWFSSSLWTFSTLGWPDETKDLEYFHPTQLLETMYDIIFFWVARMILMTTYLQGEIPFEKVYFHGMLVDEKGKKMSKSSGTGIDPVEVIEKYGADALRLSLLVANPAGNDMHLREEKIIGQRNFVNKLWNISRFVLTNLDDDYDGKRINIADLEKMELRLEDRWILDRLDEVTYRDTRMMDDYRLSLAVELLQEYIWHDLADWYVEIVKGDLFGDDRERKKVVHSVLLYVLSNVLVLMHPFAPYVTEVIWENVGQGQWGKLIEASWLVGDQIDDREKDIQTLPLVSNFNAIQVVVDSTRKMLHDFDWQHEKDIKLFIKFNVDSEYQADCVRICRILIKNVGQMELVDKLSAGMVVVASALADVGIAVPPEALNKAKDKYVAEIEKLEKYIQSVQQKLANKNYVANAPAEVVERDRDNLTEAESKLAVYRARLSSLGM